MVLSHEGSKYLLKAKSKRSTTSCMLPPPPSLVSQTLFPVLVGVAGSVAWKKGLVSLGHSLLQRGMQ